MHTLVLNGPNLNLLGKREPEIYGHKTLDDVMQELRERFEGHTFSHFQSNHEGAIVDRLQQTREEDVQGVILNGGAFTHYSYAIRDAISVVKVPVVEVHISHIFAREEFRHTSVISPVCAGMISGFGTHGYQLAADFLIHS